MTTSEIPRIPAQGGESPSPCEAVRALIPAYSIGATDPAENAFVRANLSRCPDAQAELDAYYGMAEVLHHSTPPMVAPAALRSRVLAAATPRPRSARRLTFPVAAAAALAAVIGIVFVLTTLYWRAQIEQIHADHARQSEQLGAELTAQRELLSQIGEGSVQRVVLMAAPNTDGRAQAVVMCNPNKQVGLLVAEQFPPLPPDKTYQIWLNRSGERVSGGLFRVDTAGKGTALIYAPDAIGTYETLGITDEPEGGSPGPTGKAIVRGALSYQAGAQ